MNRQIVESSNIASVGWEAGLLEVQFKNGTIYQYKGVPELLYQDLLGSPSKGRFLRDYISSDYPAEKVLDRISE